MLLCLYLRPLLPLLLLFHNGVCQTAHSLPKNARMNPTTEFLHGRAVCQQFSGDNSTRPQLVVCPAKFKYCFTSASVVRRGGKYHLNIHRTGCWLKPEADQGQCIFGSCVIGKAVDNNAITQQTCCCKGFACNKNSSYVDTVLLKTTVRYTSIPRSTSVSPAKRQTSRLKNISSKETVILGVISSVFATFLILSIVFISWRCAAQKNNPLLNKKARHSSKTVEENVQYTVIKSADISFKDAIYKGKFSTIWRAEYERAQVVIKIFNHSSCNRWKNERKIHNLLGFHSNIVELLAGVELESAFSAKKALILTYCQFGSLMHYLKSRVLSWNDMYKLIMSLANGVAYIHGEIDEYDHLKRTIIVHRNLSSSNILVKDDGTCAITGFGFATHVDVKHVEQSIPDCEILYMSPEVLSNAVNWNDKESALKQVDMYSFGLIFWEIVTRCKQFYANENVPAANLPYKSELGENPTKSALYEHICKQRKRPILPQEGLISKKSYCLLKNTVEECWDMEPEARLTALCVVKRMQEIHDLALHDKGLQNAMSENDVSSSEVCSFNLSNVNLKSNNLNQGPARNNDDRSSLVILLNNKHETLVSCMPAYTAFSNHDSDVWPIELYNRDGRPSGSQAVV